MNDHDRKMVQFGLAHGIYLLQGELFVNIHGCKREKLRKNITSRILKVLTIYRINFGRDNVRYLAARGENLSTDQDISGY